MPYKFGGVDEEPKPYAEQAVVRSISNLLEITRDRRRYQMGDDNRSSSDAAMPSLRPHGKIVIPDAFLRSSTNGSSRSDAPASGGGSRPQNGLRAAPVAPKVSAPAKAKAAAAAAAAATPKAEPPKVAFRPISPGLSSVRLPLGPSPKEEGKSVRSKEG